MTFAERVRDCFFAPERELQPWCDRGDNRYEQTIVITPGNVLVQRHVTLVSVDGYSSDRFKCATSTLVCKRELKRRDRSSSATRRRRQREDRRV